MHMLTGQKGSHCLTLPVTPVELELEQGSEVTGEYPERITAQSLQPQQAGHHPASTSGSCFCKERCAPELGAFLHQLEASRRAAGLGKRQPDTAKGRPRTQGAHSTNITLSLKQRI